MKFPKSFPLFGLALAIGFSSCQEDVVDPVDAYPTAANAAAFATYFDSATVSNSYAETVFSANSIKPVSGLGTPATPSDAFFTTTNYFGAVDPAATEWYTGWSFYSQIATAAAGTTPVSIAIDATLPKKEVTSTWMTAQGPGTISWSKDTIYVLNGFVFVDSAQTLDIAAGTVVYGKAGAGAQASALIVARNGKINAVGSATEPIIFTYDGDAGGSQANLSEKWGGLIILGNASLNSALGESQIEGIPTTESRGLYGGTNDADNSGTLQYVSIRHGGSNIGDNNEINGLTLGGVGNGTTIDYVEVIGNKDDGIEWFGGTVSAKHLIVSYCKDDALDYDEGYRGKNQFIIVHMEPTAGDRGGEHDGGTKPETATPYATPVFYNVTSIGNADAKALTFRDNAGGEYHNSIFSGYGKGVDIEDLKNENQDSYKQWVDGNLKLTNNIFSNIATGSTGSTLFKVSEVE